jgi:hypothetical protein
MRSSAFLLGLLAAKSAVLAQEVGGHFDMKKNSDKYGFLKVFGSHKTRTNPT